MLKTNQNIQFDNLSFVVLLLLKKNTFSILKTHSSEYNCQKNLLVYCVTFVFFPFSQNANFLDLLDAKNVLFLF